MKPWLMRHIARYLQCDVCLEWHRGWRTLARHQYANGHLNGIDT